MLLFLAVPFVGSLLFAATARSLSARSEPSSTTWLLTAGSAVTALATTGSLALAAWPLAARLPFVANLGDWRPQRVSHVPVPLAVSLAATLLVAVIGVRAVRVCRRVGRDVVGLAAAQRACAAGSADDVVVVDDAVPYAYALPGVTIASGRTVVSSGLLESLDPAERSAVLAHERSHLRHRHHMFAFTLDLAGALNPALTATGQRARFAIERWADEDAAREVDRAVVASSLAKASIARLERNRPSHLRAGAMLVAGYGMTDRVAAMLAMPTGRGRLGQGLTALIVVAVAGALAWASHDMERAFETIRLLS